ncbi:MAG TPA: antibiotic biosynthesis monooxygenase [Ignavibacteria bacterium]|nr:antibiotic biosynthesis monooxygenase [Ignavibacteria bacterium]HQY53237.1 antibiotic biosynthesis monooxygenase [Ignavibacteria bacterium]HRB01231.1 antibiotic biosynthesis monooxygenase [Ignavibacteria bacterium]
MKHNFVAINFIDCEEAYKERFELLFTNRAHAIDRMKGFKNMEVLKPKDGTSSYLVVSYWESEADFKKWKDSPEFLEGHRRGFEDISKAKMEGRKPPMKSSFKTYEILAR